LGHTQGHFDEGDSRPSITERVFERVQAMGGVWHGKTLDDSRARRHTELEGVDASAGGPCVNSTQLAGDFSIACLAKSKNERKVEVAAGDRQSLAHGDFEFALDLSRVRFGQM